MIKRRQHLPKRIGKYLISGNIKEYYAAKNPNCADRGKFEELWYQYKLRELPF
jgi:hypothetical protein